jgi:hypothetical protein
VDADPLADIAADLYGREPDEFVAVRDEYAKRARAAGNRQLAAAVGKLRRPTVGAWLVNLLSRERSDLVGELLALGEELRAAQRNLRGGEMRDLSQRRRRLIAQLKREAAELVSRDYHRANLPLTEVESTLGAALADPEVAELVRAGQLTKTVSYAGFGETPRPQLRLLQGGAAAEPAAPGRDKSDKGQVAPIDAGRSYAAPGAQMGLHRPTSTKGGRVAHAQPEPAKRAEREAAEQAKRAEQERREREAAEQERREREAAEQERREREAAEQERREREAAERVEQQQREAERRAAERAAAAQLKRARAAAHRELLSARTELADAESARAAAERAVTAAKRRVEKATAHINALEADASAT